MRSRISPGGFRFPQIRVGQTHLRVQTHVISPAPVSATGAVKRTVESRLVPPD
ncbi:hypothetical protein RISK_000161 [Rhodopirellula islandica]|uniref:Uncharacterized protein n=1 Tax=Rhodopirellula islandica TaxID=595434 RepID=A0A0J1BMW0_RHOIS|nr:hypothetical protein RISK_000161 [Rhodopirellula islandica]